LGIVQYMSLEDLEYYADQTIASLMYLQLESLGHSNFNADHVASHVAKAYGLVTVLRSSLHHAACERCYLPADICMHHNLSATEVIRFARSSVQSMEILESVFRSHVSSHELCPFQILPFLILIVEPAEGSAGGFSFGGCSKEIE
jgi:hypothetical protein